jgi:hypothetical protein
MKPSYDVPALSQSTSGALDKQQAVTLQQCEEVIQRGVETFIEVGNALLTIRDQRLYRAEFSTFNEYCQERWGMHRRHADRLVEAADIAENLRPIGLIPQSESQVRPLVGLPPEVQKQVWVEATLTAPNGKVTAAHVEVIAAPHKPKRHPKSQPPPPLPASTPPACPPFLGEAKRAWARMSNKNQREFLSWLSDTLPKRDRNFLMMMLGMDPKK